MKTLLKTIGVVVFVAISTAILWVMDVYNSVKNPKPEGYDEYEWF